MKAAVMTAFHNNCINMRDPMNWLSHNTWWPFPRNTYGSLLNGFQNTLRMMISENLRGSKIPSIRNLRFSRSDLVEFWLSIQHEYPNLFSKALSIFIPFATSYLCEAGF
ncbi:unnamed protein product, partial [Callosobruchus maculatus]